jgi:hypothetical protein
MLSCCFKEGSVAAYGDADLAVLSDLKVFCELVNCWVWTFVDNAYES